eukprot:1158880-Pelagomonas_calceolata.AAC.6
MIYAANVPEDDLADKGANNPYVQALRARAAEEGLEVAIVSAKVESELMELPKEEAQEWLEALGVKDGGLANLIRATYAALGLRTYFTTGKVDVLSLGTQQSILSFNYCASLQSLNEGAL